MTEIVVEFRAETIEEMQEKVKAFLETLQDYCDTGTLTEEVCKDMIVEETGDGYRYNDGSKINEALRELCKKAEVDDWRKIRISQVNFIMARKTIYGEYTYDPVSGGLYRGKIETLGKLVWFSEKDLLGLWFISKRGVECVKHKLSELGLSLAE